MTTKTKIFAGAILISGLLTIIFYIYNAPQSRIRRAINQDISGWWITSSLKSNESLVVNKRKMLGIDENWEMVYEDYDSTDIEEYYMSVINHNYIFTKDDTKLMGTDTYYYDLDQFAPIWLKTVVTSEDDSLNYIKSIWD